MLLRCGPVRPRDGGGYGRVWEFVAADLGELIPSSPQAIDQSQTAAVMATVTNDTSSKGVSWTLNGPGSLSNSTGPSVTYISATTNLTSAQQATVTATSAADQTKTALLQITVNPYPLIPFQTFANGSVGTPYSQMIGQERARVVIRP